MIRLTLILMLGLILYFGAFRPMAGEHQAAAPTPDTAPAATEEARPPGPRGHAA